MRHSLAILISSIVVGSSGLATADSFGGWLYSPPAGYTAKQWDDHVELTKHSETSFCSIAIFEARRLVSSAAIEAAWEHHNVVTPNFSAKVARRAKLKTMRGTEIAAITAALTTADGTSYAGIHYIVMPPGMIGSVLLISTSTASLRACERVGEDVVRSLDVDWSSPRITDPEARVETPQGRWAISGSTNREYTFAADGTYRFHGETTGGVRHRIVEEGGTYSVRGNQLSLAPVTATVATISPGVTTRKDLPLEPATYTWTKRYDPKTNGWSISLTPRKPTARDGNMPAGGYSYSDREPAWKYGPPGPAS